MYEIAATTGESIHIEWNPNDMTVEYEKGPRLGNQA
jgi:hypothetical protein